MDRDEKPVLDRDEYRFQPGCTCTAWCCFGRIYDNADDIYAVMAKAKLWKVK